MRRFENSHMIARKHRCNKVWRPPSPFSYAPLTLSSIGRFVNFRTTWEKQMYGPEVSMFWDITGVDTGEKRSQRPAQYIGLRSLRDKADPTQTFVKKSKLTFFAA